MVVWPPVNGGGSPRILTLNLEFFKCDFRYCPCLNFDQHLSLRRETQIIPSDFFSFRYLNNMNHFWREFMFPMARVLWNSVIPEGIKPLLLFIRPPINHCSNGTFREYITLYCSATGLCCFVAQFSRSHTQCTQ